ncbi:MAG: lamin tail domain-containing protein [Nocardioidaceae bacterium]
MVRRILLASLLGFVCLTVGPASAAGGGVFINFVQYDSPGPDHGSNYSLNHEYVVVTNGTAHLKRLKGWTLRDTSGHVFHFPRTNLRPGHSVKVHTGKGANNPGDRYWGQSYYVWNNDGDTAILRNKAGALADKCHWDSTGGGSTGC